MGFGELLAHIFEYGARTHENKNADPRMVRYGAGYYPEDVGVDLVILDLEDYRQSARLAEPRLAVELEELCINLDCSLQSKASEGGKRFLDFLKDQKLQNSQYPYRIEGNPEGIDQANFTKDKRYDQNQNYR